MLGTMFLVDTSGSLLGMCSHERAGWLFIPALRSQRATFTFHPTATKAIPSWALEQADDLLTDEEWRNCRTRVGPSAVPLVDP